MTQEQFATACGVRRRAQSSYENDERCPDSKYLAAASTIGVAVGYVLTGRRCCEEQPAADRVAPDIGQPDLVLLSRVLEGIDTATAKRAVQLVPKQKAMAAVMLYRAFKMSGKVDPTVIEEAVALASG